MKKEELSFKSSNDLYTIKGVMYIPKGKIKGILQIAHGMTEHIDRYEGFAEYLCDNGYLVCGNDHMGHGKSINTDDDLGFFGKKDSYLDIVEDMHTLTLMVKEKYPNIKYYLLGHSMGSFLTRNYLFKYSNELDGSIIMGTGMQPKIALLGGKFFCNLIALFKGWKHRSTFVTNLAMGSNLKGIDNPKTQYDWLTKDESIIDKYSKDPYCTFTFTLNGYLNLFNMIYELHSKDNLNKMNKDLRVLFVSGERDPIGNFTKSVDESIKSFKDVGMKNIEHKYYETDRHEILNELDKDIVYKDILDWLNK